MKSAYRGRPAQIWLFVLLATSLRADADPLAAGEKAAGDWIKIRLETADIDTEWRSQRPLLESTVAGLKERAATIEEKRDQVKAKTAKNRDELSTMQAKGAAAADDLLATDARLQAVSAKLINLRPSLPPRLSEALEMSYRSLAKPELGTGERMQLMMTMLGRCSQFNRTITCGEEVLSIGDQGARSLEVIYWGLSHGYALDPAGGMAWYGSPGPSGWRWESRPESTGAVAKLIAIYNDRADPEFIAVPATLAHPVSAASAK